MTKRFATGSAVQTTLLNRSIPNVHLPPINFLDELSFIDLPIVPVAEEDKLISLWKPLGSNAEFGHPLFDVQPANETEFIP